MSDDHERILALAVAARAAERSPLWKTDMEAAIDAQSDAVDALFAEIDRQIDERALSGNPVKRQKPPPDPKKEARREITALLKAELPALINSILDDRP